MKPYSIPQRADLFNRAFPHLLPIAVGSHAGRPFLFSFWFVGGGNVSEFFGSYQVEYLNRINAMFTDAEKVVHLFSGSLPPSDKYTRVGIDYTGKHKSDLEIDVHQLSTYMSFNPDLIMADPPYEEVHGALVQYKCGKVNTRAVLDECAAVLKPGGFVVWMDTALPIFSNDRLRHVGGISYIRSTGNRFRVVSFFQKPANTK